jgi:hypothetical protein
MADVKEALSFYIARKRLRFSTTNVEEMLRALACVLVCVIMSGEDEVDGVDSASQYAIDQAAMLEEDLVLRRIDPVPPNITSYLVLVKTLFEEWVEEVNQEIHNDLMAEFRAKGLHGMHASAACPASSPLREHRCVICLDAAPVVNASTSCTHGPVLCADCKVQSCPMRCNM